MPTETTAPRLIDANALDIALRDAYYACDESKDHHDKFLMSWLNSARRILESAPTVETTDDVLAKLNDRTWEVILKNSFQESEWIARYYPTIKESYEWLNSPENGFWKTPLEAVKRLEESLNK